MSAPLRGGENIVVLAEVRAKLSADRRLAEQVGAQLANRLVSEAIRQANRAFLVAGPIAGTDEAMSRIIHRGVLRRLRADVRGAFKGTPAELQSWAVEKAVQIYERRIFTLIDLRDGRSQGGRS